MHTLTPLLFAIILINISQLKNDFKYRASVFCLIGGAYFSAILYLNYCLNLFANHLFFYSASISVILLTTLLCLSKWFRKSSIIKTLSCVSFFLTSMLFYFVLEVPAKEKIAEWGGYFKPFETPTSGIISPTVKISIPDRGIKIGIPENWHKMTTASQHLYFADRTELKNIELRPNCFNSLSIDTPSLIKNIITAWSTNPEREIFKCEISTTYKQCMIKIQHPINKSIKERWKFIKMFRSSNFGGEVDIIFFNRPPQILDALNAAIYSLEISPSIADSFCTTPAEWL